MYVPYNNTWIEESYARLTNEYDFQYGKIHT